MLPPMEMGLRERKKQQTRRRITDVAIRLFAERGFDHVPVAEIARQAEVAEATVFNYFPTKEDLVYQGMDEYEGTKLDAIRTRAPGTSVLEAFRALMSRPQGALVDDDPAAMGRIATIARIIAGSTALQTRELRSINRHTASLAELIAADDHAETIEPWVVANALMGVQRAMTGVVHRMALAGHDGPTIARAVVAQAQAALDVLERGLAGYAPAP
jgi:AcrR family transcriptional regulator